MSCHPRAAATAYLTVRLLAPPLFDHQIGMMSGSGIGMGRARDGSGATPLGNALRATPPGGTVTVTLDVTADQARATVTDTGVGLAGADLDRVFERFYRAADGLPKSAGSGVGLTIARGIARAHGGDLRAASLGAGRGSALTLTLPRHTPTRG